MNTQDEIKIPVKRGGFALIDKEDLEKVKSRKWYLLTGYAISVVNKKSLLMHRIIMNTPNGKFTDHINGNRLDNRKSNLRICTKQENNQNALKFCKTSSIFKGVCWDKRASKWKTTVTNKFIGLFKEERHAAMAYDIWAKELFGEFANTNF